jgi:hypothetical protein
VTSPRATPPASRAARWLDKIFSPREVERDPRLKMLAAALFAFFFLTFYFWWQNATTLSTRGAEVFDFAPSSFIENLHGWVFLNAFQTKVYLYLLGMFSLLGMVSLFLLRSSRWAMALLAWLFVNKFYFYLCDFRLFANYHHFHLFFTLIFLVSRNKLRCFRFALAVGYVMSGVVKLTPGWLHGEYFNSMAEKLPLLPKLDSVVIVASKAVIVLEFLGPLCWFTRVRALRWLSFAAFLGFHIYSGIIVGFWYTALMLPLVVAAFLRFRLPLQTGYRFARRDVAVFAICAATMLAGVWHYFIPGDVRLTGEARYLGFYMFDANRQVRFETEIEKGNQRWVFHVFRPFREGDEGGAENKSEIGCQYFRDGALVEDFPVVRPVRDGDTVIFNPQFFLRADVRMYGNPYLYYRYARELVRRHHPDRVTLRLDEQLDGHAQVTRLLDIADFARLNPTYHSFTRNDWILLPK